MIKICTGCKLEKEIADYSWKCKECRSDYYKKNKNKILDYQKEYNSSNKDKIVEYQKEYNLLYPKEIDKEYQKKYQKEYNVINKEAIKENHKEYYLKNKDKKDKYTVNYYKERKKIDPLFKLSCNLRCMINKATLGKGYPKNSKTEAIIGKSFQDMLLYIESKFETWMNWDNYGLYNGTLKYGWDIDHIIPLSKAINSKELLNLNYYTNLQPLCSKVNRDIKKDN
jgi:hypothetical protein